jgi:hypothetical protein
LEVYFGLLKTQVIDENLQLFIFGTLQLHCLEVLPGKDSHLAMKYLNFFLKNIPRYAKFITSLKLTPLVNEMISDIIESKRLEIWSVNHPSPWHCSDVAPKQNHNIPHNKKKDKRILDAIGSMLSEGASLGSILDKWKSFSVGVCDQIRLRRAMKRMYEKLSTTKRTYYPFYKREKKRSARVGLEQIMTQKECPYNILKVQPKGANYRTIKKAFMKAALKYHPDKNPSIEAKVQWERFRKAFEQLEKKHK